MDVAGLRKDYREAELHRKDLAADPYEQFARWFAEALACERISEANAMTLSTAGSDGAVSSRTVLLKDCTAAGFAFFTNYESRKAQQLAENPRASLLFPWLPMERQVVITGRAEKTSRAESLAYFSTRPLASKIGALISEQSQVIPSRKSLEEKFTAWKDKHPDGNVPLPDYWGGYRVIPETIEFWQGRTSRLHDRFLYTKESRGVWRIDRLSP